MVNADRIARKYQDADAASRYEATRAKGPAWQREQRVVESFLRTRQLETCLDVPVGTGRFFGIYAQRGMRVTGIDISPAMIDQAAGTAAALGMRVDLRSGSVFNVPFPDRSFDVVICWRLLNWLSPKELERALSETVRVSDAWIIVSIRHRLPTLRSFAAEQKRRFLRATGRYASFGHREDAVRCVFDRLGIEVHERYVMNSRPKFMEHVGWLLRR